MAGNLVVLEREFVVVRNFLVDFDVAPRVDNDLLQRFHGDDLCTAVWLKNTNTQVQSVSDIITAFGNQMLLLITIFQN